MVSLGIQMLFAQACPLPFVYVQMSFAHMQTIVPCTMLKWHLHHQ